MATYDELIATAPVEAYARNADLIASMPAVLARAETYIIERLDHDAFRAAPLDVTLPTTTGQVTLPADTLEPRGLRMRWRSTSWTPLLPRNEETLQALYSSAPAGRPAYYCRIASDTLQVMPRPSVDTPGQLVINQRPPALGPTMQTSILTTRWGNVLHAALIREASLFMADQGLITLYTNEVGEMLMAANLAVARWRRDETAQRPRETANVKGA